ncbi:MAG: tRNA (N(6)-L-threonylcarbamoyladenosine(37)-C(2))-methylthiotransferase MtaB [Candidatus Aegiribacteria sp.]|nr:tRNA (N(6)-L-threonylcarbamoyladenosine(37)-C(2))-methylthiotransferase MtaB [Candidatus Aegiribacteria sp.]
MKKTERSKNSGTECGRGDDSLPRFQHRIYGHTLRCRLNAFETEAILEEFRRRCGVERVSDPGDASIILVNSCAVTGRSTARSRKAVRGFCRRTDAEVVVTGCVAEVTPEEFDDQDVVILPNTAKKDLVDIIAGRLGIPLSNRSLSLSESAGAIFPFCAPEFIARTRAFLKIQDGCDNHCTYCIVPAARGPSRSQPRELVLSQAESLASAGFLEILLTGVDLVRYGKDLYGNDYGLVHLVRDLLEMGGFRIRLSSMEPIGLSTDMLEGIAYPGVCRHLHIPVQSGSDRILEKMGRMYSSDDINKLFDRSMELFPGIGIGADVIVGFPGETESDFKKTVDLVSHPAVAYLHVFPFSARPGTPAALMLSDMIHTETVTDRAEYLRSLSREKRNRFRRSQIGSDVLVLVESRTDGDSGRLIGMTDNYIPVISPRGSREGEMVEMTLTERDICWSIR